MSNSTKKITIADVLNYVKENTVFPSAEYDAKLDAMIAQNAKKAQSGSKTENKTAKANREVLAPQIVAYLRSIAPSGATATDIGNLAFDGTQYTSQKVTPIMNNILIPQGTVCKKTVDHKTMYFIIAE